MTTSTGGPSRALQELPPIEGVKAPLCERGTIGDGGGTRSRRILPFFVQGAIQGRVEMVLSNRLHTRTSQKACSAQLLSVSSYIK